MHISTVIVLEDEKECIASTIKSFLENFKFQETYTILRYSQSIESDRNCALLVSPEKAVEFSYTENEYIFCKALITPETASHTIYKHMRFDYVVSYGLSQRSTITYSSLGRENSIISLQRKIATLSDRILESQELPVKITEKLEPISALAVYSALLMLDFPLRSLNRNGINPFV